MIQHILWDFFLFKCWMMCWTHPPNPPRFTFKFQMLEKNHRYVLVYMNPLSHSSFYVSLHMVVLVLNAAVCIEFVKKCSYWSSITTCFHLSSIPVGSIKVVDLQDEVLLHSLQPLNSDTLVRHPGDRSQVVLAGSEQKE